MNTELDIFYSNKWNKELHTRFTFEPVKGRFVDSDIIGVKIYLDGNLFTRYKGGERTLFDISETFTLEMHLFIIEQIMILTGHPEKVVRYRLMCDE